MREKQKNAGQKIDKIRSRGVVGLALASAAALLLTGCGNMIPEMTEDQEQAISEYTAMLLLKYDANSRSRLVDYILEEALNEEPEPEPEPELPPEEDEPQGMDPVADTPVVDLPPENGMTDNTVGSMEEFFQLPVGMTLAFQGTQTTASYPEDGEMGSYFTLDATSGKSLLVLHYTLNNQSGMDQNVDFLSSSSVFKVTVNGDYTRTALVTMLEDDMSVYAGTLAAGESQNLVLLIEIDQSMADSISSVSLSVQDGSNEYTSPLI